jgi:hypothetical protein
VCGPAERPVRPRPFFYPRSRVCAPSSTDEPVFVSTACNLYIAQPVESPYENSGSNPNHIIQSLMAMLVGLQVPFLCTDTHELGEEMVASFLYQAHLYHWLETEGHGRFLINDDI